MATVLAAFSASLFAQQDLGRQALDILSARCGACHGATAMSGLDLRDRAAALKGGKRGPALVPGQPDASLLFQAAAHSGELKMPPGAKQPLAAGELEALRVWIRNGANWNAPLKTAKTWWAFEKPRRAAVPSGAKHPIDAFLNAKLAEKKLTVAAKADKRTLLRRVTFDLTGLPPTPEQLERFLADSRPDAWQRLVDGLLASPRYGERWGRRWLDVVRYADSAGFEADVFYPNAWRYRDYVIKSFNEDKPYDRFVQEQIAGDELWPNDMGLEGFYDVPPEKLEHLEARVGTSVYTLGPEIFESMMDAARLRNERLTDAVDLTGSAFLGLTIGCARCHDHKFDPIPQRDYYRLQAVFAPSEPRPIPVVTGMTRNHRDESYHTMLTLAEARRARQIFEKKIRDRVVEARKKEFSAAALKAYEIPAEKRNSDENEMAAPLVRLFNEVKIEEQLNDAEKAEYRKLGDRIIEAVMNVPPHDGSHAVKFDGFYDLPSATVLDHIAPELIPPTYILRRGELSLKGERVNAGLPSVLGGAGDLKPGPLGARYRKELALWLTTPDHPLTARVLVNRVWQGHFGRGIVSTANDFGTQGQPPTHPELLDWLATEFAANNWSLKSLHRLILTSEAYQRSSTAQIADSARLDPDNQYLWRMNRQRLDAESLWDCIHSVAGTLNLRMGGRPVMPPLSSVELEALRIKAEWAVPADPEDARRRAVYVIVRRNFPFPMFDKFDRPDPAVSCPVREVTTVAPQALWSLNNSLSHDQARQFAARVRREAGGDTRKAIERAWVLATSRPPTAVELEESEKLISGVRGGEPLERLCLALFNLNEFGYVD